MSDFLLDAVAQFLKGDQWLEPVNAFMHANKLAFVGLAGPQESYSLQQHAVFVEFKDLAERLLEGIVQDLGCEPSTFVAALEEAVVNEAGGPKEEEVQLLVKTLLAYDDFHGFCALMQTYVEWNAVPSMPPDENEMQFSGADEFQVVDGAAAFDATKYFGSHEWILQEVVARSLLDAQTAGTTLSAEDELCHLCDRMETIQVELKAIKKRCFGFKSVSQAHLDEIRIQPSDSAIVPDLLQWLLLESEAHEVQVEVQSRSFLSPRAEAKEVDLNDRWVQHWSGDDGTYYYLNSVTGESRWDPPMSKDGEPIVGYWDNDNQWVPYAFLAPGDTPPVDMTADSKGDVTPLEQKLRPLETKPWTPSADLTVQLISTGPFVFNGLSSLQKVLQEHADESKKLEIALQGISDMISSSYRWPYDSWLIIFLWEVEHARQTQDIQRRKAQRRKERKVKKAEAHDGGDAKTLVAPPPPVDLSALNALIDICLPEGGKFDLLNLLSEADERVRRERRGDAGPKNDGAPASLNATSLRYLAEKLAPTSKLIEIEDV
ncbi:hypothetical protein B5M09_007636 [Aphanomyces astaci]|uniref:Cilia- and flagella-associated protein 36 n=1 Tax=Aphanomyces astaci TaxID=112090 RepID=A0A3R7YFX4_APHAT|nr:hypothetical protein B5M09_007636 [Aphanomyces astaci]